MVMDSSALIAILLGEPEAEALAVAMADAPKRLLGVVTALETSIVIEAKKGEFGGRELDLLLRRTGVDIVGMDAAQWELAREAWRQFGKGRHPAGLNIGDCCSYALARHTREPLLFKGEDFPSTDVSAVLWAAPDKP